MYKLSGRSQLVIGRAPDCLIVIYGQADGCTLAPDIIR